MDNITIQKISQDIYQNIYVILDSKSDPNLLLNANHQLNEIITKHVINDSNIFIKVAMNLINGQEIPVDHLKEISIDYGFKILEKIVKFKWYSLDQNIKKELQDFSIQYCDQKLTSSLILNSGSRFITEIFFRDWPTNWKDFFPDITKNCSLMTIYTILNISYSINKLYEPNNALRRKEITKLLLMEKELLYNYFIRCLSMTEDNNPEYIKFIWIKSLEAIDSLLEWFILDEAIIIKIINIAIGNDFNSDYLFSMKLKTLEFGCIQTAIQRQCPRFDDAIIISDIFFDLSPNKFSHYLITELHSYMQVLKSKPNDQLFELFPILIDIIVKIATKIIVLYNQDSTNTKLRNTYTSNEEFWSKFISFCFDCLEMNLANFDVILLPFFIQICKHNPDTNSEIQSDKRLKLPIPEKLSNCIPLKLMILIGKYKLDLKPEFCTTELHSFYNIENYSKVYFDNKCKFVSIMNNFIVYYPEICRELSLNLLKNLLGPVEHYQSSIDTNVKSWNMCINLIPKLKYSDQQIKILEIYFSRALALLTVSNNDPDYLNSILSFVSSLDSLYNLFSSDLIKNLIDSIFTLSIGINQKEVENHLGALFIKLNQNCYSLFLPYFQIMCSHIDNLAKNSKLYNKQICYLYEGLFILSNYLTIEEQRSFLNNYILSQINWITTYDLGVNGINFFNDIWLSKEPELDTTAIPYSPFFVKIKLTANIFDRLLRRINSKRCFEILGKTLYDYALPFLKIISFIHQLWYYYNEKLDNLNAYCHPFYQRYYFEEISHCHITSVINKPLLIADKFKTLMTDWDTKTPPSADLVGHFIQNKLWQFYSSLINVLNSILNYQFLFYSIYPTMETIIEDYIKNCNILFGSNIEFMPIFVYNELIRFHYQPMVSYLPRSEKFLSNTECLGHLVNFINLLYNKLEKNFQIIEDQKSSSTKQYSSSLSASRSFASYDNQMEIYLEYITNIVCLDFVLLLNNIFMPAKNIVNVINKNELNKNNNSINEASMMMMMDEEMEDDNEPVINENNKTDEQPLVNEDNYNEDGLLSKFLLTFNPNSLTTVIMGCLLWRIDNVKIHIANSAQHLINSLLARNMINNLDTCYQIMFRILESISITNRTDGQILNILIGIILSIYRKYIVKNNLTTMINEKLSQICGGNLRKWNEFAFFVERNEKNNHIHKKTEKLLKNLLQDITINEVSMEKAIVLSLGILDQ